MESHGLPSAAFAPVVLTVQEAASLLSGSGKSPKSSGPISRGYLPSDLLIPITGLTGEHELFPVDSAALRQGTESRLTFMIRKLPRFLTPERFKECILEIQPIDGSYDMIYVPVYMGKQGNNRGYAFINFVDKQRAAVFVELLALGNVPDDLVNCEIVFAHVQGKDNMINRLRESTIHKRVAPAVPFLFPTKSTW